MHMLAVKYDYLCIGRLRDFPKVVMCSCGDSMKENLLCHPTTQHHAHSVKQLLLGEQVLFLRQILGIAQTLPSWNN